MLGEVGLGKITIPKVFAMVFFIAFLLAIEIDTEMQATTVVPRESLQMVEGLASVGMVGGPKSRHRKALVVVARDKSEEVFECRPLGSSCFPDSVWDQINGKRVVVRYAVVRTFLFFDRHVMYELEVDGKTMLDYSTSAAQDWEFGPFRFFITGLVVAVIVITAKWPLK